MLWKRPCEMNCSGFMCFAIVPTAPTTKSNSHMFRFVVIDFGNTWHPQLFIPKCIFGIVLLATDQAVGKCVAHPSRIVVDT